MSDINIIIPVKTNSSRVANKNFRPFSAGKSLFDIKALQLLKAGVAPSTVYVSSEEPSVKDTAEVYGFNFICRDQKYTLDSTPESEWLSAVVDQTPPSDDIAVIRVTQPLFDDYRMAFAEWQKARLLGCDSFDITGAFRHHVVDDSGRPVNYQFGYWHTYSQDLPKWHQLGGVCSIVRRDVFDKIHYLVGRRPKFIDSKYPLVDIDTMEDFNLARIIYEETQEIPG